ncbi:C-type lectin mosGCTL-7-like [Diabrotica undecimpunctata]|uniref:C-type lectin mosGCTL-7-like n=1 Tax=Diabrotica undecimpunctata TaxID=50387 RepID=UPI003B635A48
MKITATCLTVVFLFVSISEAYIRDDSNTINTVRVSSKPQWEKNFENGGLSTLPLLRFENKLYYLGLHVTESWINAITFCETLQMKLLSINSARENEKIGKFVREQGIHNRYWIGGARFIDDRKYLWIPYGREIDYSNWPPGHPVQNAHKCILVQIFGAQLNWVEGDCNVPLNFICEKYVENWGPTGAL